MKHIALIVIAVEKNMSFFVRGLARYLHHLNLGEIGVKSLLRKCRYGKQHSNNQYKVFHFLRLSKKVTTSFTVSNLANSWSGMVMP